ncbi:hypothetical protein GCM10010174_69580 [Kutzneria viridogrisea]|uniref:Thioredoxin n=1 Tax=Kutzneria viridogrisea TaxID=47990 RepID=A0ABR6BB00_9PSEU|nr:putative thioredoxin [Kutzneria viridogrisea]
MFGISKVLGALVAVAAALAMAAPTASAAQIKDDSIVTLTPSNQQQVLDMSKTKLVIMDFGATWCPGCRQLKPWLEQQARSNGGKWILAEVDVDQNRSFTNGYSIKYIPTLIAHKNGAEMGHDRGAARDNGTMMSNEQIKAWIAKKITEYGS